MKATTLRKVKKGDVFKFRPTDIVYIDFEF